MESTNLSVDILPTFVYTRGPASIQCHSSDNFGSPLHHNAPMHQCTDAPFAHAPRLTAIEETIIDVWKSVNSCQPIIYNRLIIAVINICTNQLSDPKHDKAIEYFSRNPSMTAREAYEMFLI